MDNLKKIAKDFATQYELQDRTDPIEAVIQSDRSIVTERQAEQATAKHLNNPAVKVFLDEILDTKQLIQKTMDLVDHKIAIVKWDDKNEQAIVHQTDITDPQTSLKALDMAFKLKGMYAPEQRATVNLNLNSRLADNPQITEITEEYEDKLKAMFEKGNNQPTQ